MADLLYLSYSHPYPFSKQVDAAQLWFHLLSLLGMIHHLTHDHPHHIWQDLVWSSRRSMIDDHFLFLLFPNNQTKTCHPLIKLLPDSLVALVYNLVPDVLGQLFGLTHGSGEVRIEEIDSADTHALYM